MSSNRLIAHLKHIEQNLIVCSKVDMDSDPLIYWLIVCFQVDMESDPVSEFIVHCKATHGLHSFAWTVYLAGALCDGDGRYDRPHWPEINWHWPTWTRPNWPKPKWTRPFWPWPKFSPPHDYWRLSACSVPDLIHVSPISQTGDISVISLPLPWDTSQYHFTWIVMHCAQVVPFLGHKAPECVFIYDAGLTRPGNTANPKFCTA